MSSNQVALFILLVFNLSCEERQREILDESDLPIQKTSRYDNSEGTAPQVITIPAIEVIVKPLKPARPQYKLLTNRPSLIKIPSKVQPGGKPRTVQIPSKITMATPGQNGFAWPKTVNAKGKKVLSKHPRAVPALAPGIRDEASVSIQYLDIDQGMSSSSVNWIMEDNRGHLWFGTNGGGASRYDGISFTHLNMKTGLCSDAIACILEDRRGNLWLGTKGGGVNLFDGNALFHFDEDVGLNGNYVESIVEDRNGNIWLGMRRGGGLTKYDGTNFSHFTEREGLISNNVRCLLYDSQDNLWIGTGKGVSKFDGSSFYQYTTVEGLCDNHVESIVEDSYGNIWFGTMGGGVSRLDAAGFTHYGVEEGLTNNSVLTIAEDNGGELWFGTRGGGVCHFHDGQFTRYDIENGLSNNHVTTIKLDRKGFLWLGTWGGGVNKLNSSRFNFIGKEDGLSSNHIRALLEDSRGNLWVGTEQGVSRYDGKNFTHFGPDNGLGQHPILSTLPVISILEDSRDNLWFGTDLGGVNKFDGRGFTHYSKEEGLSNSAILCMLEDSKGYIWFGTRDGLTRFDQESNFEAGTFTSYLAGRQLWVGSMLEDSKGNIWLGSTSGTILFDGTSFRFYTLQQGLASNGVSCILEDSNGNLWFGSDHGVNRFDGTEFENYDIDDGLPDNNVRSIIEDNNKNIWLSTERGIVALVPNLDPSSADGSETRDYQFFPFGKGDGLKKLDFSPNSACLDQKNRIWWGCAAGLTILDLNKFTFQKDTPVINLTSIELMQTHLDYRRLRDAGYRSSISFGDLLDGAFDSIVPFQNYPVSLSLPHGINYLTFHFSANDIGTPHQLRYRFFLKGADHHWSPPKAINVIDYRNLTPGSYTFQAMVIGAGQVWSLPTTYSFSIYPPWWQTTWAYSIYGILILMVLYAIRQYERNRQNLRHELELENLRANKLEEINVVKTRFFANISHEFRTPLTLMLGPVKELIGSYPKTNLDYLHLIQRGGHRLLNLINQLLMLTKLDTNREKLQASHQDFIPFTRKIFSLFTTRANSRNIQYTYHSTSESQFGYFNPGSFERILINLLDNAFKFTPEGGAIRMEIENSDSGLVVTISDTGPGIPAALRDQIFERFFRIDQADSMGSQGTGIGLALVKELVELHYGTIKIQSEIGQGSRFILQLPLGKGHLQEDEIVARRSREASIDVSILGSPLENSPVVDPAEIIDEELPLVLVVEDNADMRTYIRQSLVGQFRIAEAADGVGALKYARKYIPDFILSDVMMAGMSGLTLCQKLRSDSLTSHIPIILITAKAEKVNLLEGLSQGADAYLTKPFDKEELLLRMHKLIELRKKLQVHYQNLGHLDSSEDAGQKMEDEFIRHLRKHIEDNLGNHLFDIPQLCRLMQRSRAQLYRKVKALTGKSVGHFIRLIRLRKALQLLKSSPLNISEIAYEVGFQDPAYFSRMFSEEYGISPKKAR